MNTYFNEQFYCDSHGKPSIVPRSLNCLYGTLYFHCKLRLKDTKHLATMFMQKTGLGLVKNIRGDVKHFGSISYTEKSYKGIDPVAAIKAFEINSNKSLGINALSNIERQLDKGVILSLDAYCHRLPFYFSFRGLDAPFDKTENRVSHFVLLLGHTKEEIFYVEDPDHLNIEGYVSHPRNKYIGIIKKHDLLKALNVFSECYEVDFNMELVRHYSSFDFYKAYLQNFVNEFESRGTWIDGLYFLYGEKCYEEFIDLLSLPFDCFSERMMQLEQRGSSNLKMFLSWQFHDVLSSRKILFAATHEWGEVIPPAIFQDMIVNLSYSLRIWEHLSQCVSLGSQLNGEELRLSLLKNLEFALDIEKSLVRTMKKTCLQ